MELDICPGCDGWRERLHNDGLMHICTLCNGTGNVPMNSDECVGFDEETAVRKLGEKIGYGKLMNLAAQIWSKKQPGGAFAVGPCVGCLVPCPCNNPVRCDWCEGSGRITKRVMRAMEEANKASRLPR